MSETPRPQGSESSDSPLIRFYRGTGNDHAGRTIDRIWSFDHVQLEEVHDYVQWLFPNPGASRYNPEAPLLSPADAETFAGDPGLVARAVRSLDLMLEFYGMVRSGTSVARGPAFPDRRDMWVLPGDHNHLRLSRILVFLNEIGLRTLARSLQYELVDIAGREGRGVISPKTQRLWEAITPSANAPFTPMPH